MDVVYSLLVCMSANVPEEGRCSLHEVIADVLKYLSGMRKTRH